MITEIDEQNAAVVADAMHPAREAHVGPHVALAERAAGVGAITMQLSLGHCRKPFGPCG
jgi:hypothetical protein